VPDWARRYGTPLTSWRPPASKVRQDELAIACARDGYALLEAVYGKTALAWLRELPPVDVLRTVPLQNYKVAMSRLCGSSTMIMVTRASRQTRKPIRSRR
jgi:hypothetical protein